MQVRGKQRQFVITVDTQSHVLMYKNRRFKSPCFYHGGCFTFLSFAGNCL